MVPEQAKWLLRHANGCGEPAFYLSREPYAGMCPAAQEVWFPDGTQPKPGDGFKCGSCGALLEQGSVYDPAYKKDLSMEYIEER
jgi:hypothetical protein